MTRAVVIFVGITYALSIAIGLIVGLTGGHQSRFAGLGFAAMFVPAIAVFILSVTMHVGPRIRWGRFPLKYVPLALLLVPIALHAAMLPATAAFEGGLPWQDWLTPQVDGLYHTSAERGWGTLSGVDLARHIAINALLGLISVSILAFFEEIGWRGWLLPRLIDRMGARRAIVVVAVIWSLWHVPFVLSGILFDVKTPASMLLAVVSQSIGTIAFGLVIGWLWVRTESIWIVSLAHGALNNWGQYAFKFMRDFTVANDLLVLDAGALAVLVVGILLLTADASLASHGPRRIHA